MKEEKKERIIGLTKRNIAESGNDLGIEEIEEALDYLFAIRDERKRNPDASLTNLLGR